MPTLVAKALIQFRATRFALGCAVVVGLADCALRSLQYMEPMDGHTAELVFLTDAPLNLLFYRDARYCTDSLQTRGARAGRTAYSIPADKDFAFDVGYVGGSGSPITGGLIESCGESIISFHPEEQKRYQFRFTLNRDGCRWAFMEIDGQPVKFVNRVRDPNPFSLGGEGKWCKPITPEPPR